MWEIWLHRIFDQSYTDFVNSLDPEKNAASTKEEIENIVSDSESILNAFLPAIGEGGMKLSAGDNADQ